MRIAIILAAILLTLILLVSAHAASSTNVSLENNLYSDMEFWAAEGLIGSNLYSIKPLTRSEVGNQLAAALGKCYAMKISSATCVNIKNQYAKLFEAEITEVKSPKNISDTFLKPIESFSASYTNLSGPFSIYNHEGIHYGESHNAMIQFQSQARLWKGFSFFVQPALIYNQHFGQAEDGSTLDVRLHKGYVKLTAFNVELAVGRDSLWWGPGYHGALLMSNNAHPFDMIKVSNPEPVLLPWIFSYLGPVQFNLIFSELNDERSGEQLVNPYLYGGRLGIKPHPFLELGASHLVMFGGEGRRDLSFSDIVKTLYGNENRDNQKTDSNQEFAVDIALTLPNIKRYIFVADGLKLYFEWGAEDTGIPPDRRAYIAGFALYKPFALDRAVLRGEYADLSPSSVPNAWYNHGSYPMNYDDRVFGHHAGSDAEDIFAEWFQNFEKFFYRLGFDRERNGIQTKTDTQMKNQYFSEIGYRFNAHSKITLRYAYEEIKNFGYVHDEHQRNHFMGLEAAFYF